MCKRKNKSRGTAATHYALTTIDSVFDATPLNVGVCLRIMAFPVVFVMMVLLLLLLVLLLLFIFIFFPA